MKKQNYQRPMTVVIDLHPRSLLKTSYNGIDAERQNYTKQDNQPWE